MVVTSLLHPQMPKLRRSCCLSPCIKRYYLGRKTATASTVQICTFHAKQAFCLDHLQMASSGQGLASGTGVSVTAFGLESRLLLRFFFFFFFFFKKKPTRLKPTMTRQLAPQARLVRVPKHSHCGGGTRERNLECFDGRSAIRWQGSGQHRDCGAMSAASSAGDLSSPDHLPQSGGRAKGRPTATAHQLEGGKSRRHCLA